MLCWPVQNLKEKLKNIYKKYYLFILLPFIFNLINNCRNSDELDLMGPELLWNKWQNETFMELMFNEPVEKIDRLSVISLYAKSDNLQFIYKESIENEFVSIHINNLKPGLILQISGHAIDRKNNAQVFNIITPSSNPEPAIVCLNEIRIKSNKKNPDMIEMKVISPGIKNIGSLGLLFGGRDFAGSIGIFPGLDVKKDDWILVSFKRPLQDEENTDGNFIFLKHKKAMENQKVHVFDLVCKNHLANSTGAVIIYNTAVNFAANPIVDSIIYADISKKQDDFNNEPQKYLRWQNYYSKLFSRFFRFHAWNGLENEILWECLVDSTYSTITRTICRRADSQDTDSKNDWHVVPTRMSTFAGSNSNLVHNPNK